MKDLMEEFISKMDQKEFELNALHYDKAQIRQKSYANAIFKEMAPFFDFLIRLTPNRVLALQLMLKYYEAGRDKTQGSHSHPQQQFCVSQLLSNLEKDDR